MPRNSLPHCDDLFVKYFDRWYDDGDRKRKIYRATCPDVTSGIAAVGTPAAQLTPLLGKTLQTVVGQVETMVNSAKADWVSDFGAKDPISLGGHGAFDK